MIPQTIHRYSWPIREAVEALLGDAVGDCKGWEVRVEADELVIDVVGPAEVTFKVGDYECTVDGRAASPAPVASTMEPAGEAMEATSRVAPDETAKRDVASPDQKEGRTEAFPETAPGYRPIDERSQAPEPAGEAQEIPEEPRKGGPLARRAAMIGAARGFWTFVDLEYERRITSPEEAAVWIREHCNIRSRADLDHDSLASETFRDLDRAYSVWLDGY